MLLQQSTINEKFVDVRQADDVGVFRFVIIRYRQISGRKHSSVFCKLVRLINTIVSTGETTYFIEGKIYL